MPCIAFCGTTTTGQRWLPLLRGASVVVGWKAFRWFDDELGIVPSYSGVAPALGVLLFEQRRRDDNRRNADDDMEAPSVPDDCSDLEHGHRHTPNACAYRESAVSPGLLIPSSEACPIEGACVAFPPKRDSGGSTTTILTAVARPTFRRFARGRVGRRFRQPPASTTFRR
jgi:hypothetical protein